MTFFFITFLSMPTIVALIEKKSDVSLGYSISDEEETLKEIKELKEIKATNKQNFNIKFFENKINPDSKIISENLSRHDNVTSTIFSPPPELV